MAATKPDKMAAATPVIKEERDWFLDDGWSQSYHLVMIKTEEEEEEGGQSDVRVKQGLEESETFDEDITLTHRPVVKEEEEEEGEGEDVEVGEMCLTDCRVKQEMDVNDRQAVLQQQAVIPIPVNGRVLLEEKLPGAVDGSKPARMRMGRAHRHRPSRSARKKPTAKLKPIRPLAKTTKLKVSTQPTAKPNMDKPVTMASRPKAGKEVAKTFPCPQCPKSFSQKYHLQEHMYVHAEVETFRCEVCGKAFRHRRSYSRHLHSHEKDIELEINLVKPEGASCRFCSETFHRRKDYVEHLQTHKAEWAHQCAQCGAVYTLKGTLQRHMKSHSGKRPHKCNFCPKAFIRLAHLTIHLRKHTGERPFSCSSCDRTFTRRDTMENHRKKEH